MFGIHLRDYSKEAKTQKNDNDVTVSRCEVIVIFFFDAAMFLIASLVTGPSFMSILLLVVEL